MLLGLLSLATAASAAEIRGRVELQHSDLFGMQQHATGNQWVGIALWPLEHQAPPTVAREHHRVEVRDGSVKPGYLLLRPGDVLELNNQDAVQHQFFALVPDNDRRISVRLGTRGNARRHSLVFPEPGTRHLFCRIHPGQYLRVDVVDAPLLKRVRPGERFEFRELASGKWKLRLAGPGAASRTVEAVAMTAPPPLELNLPMHGAARPDPGDQLMEPVSVDQLFPGRSLR